MIKHYVTWIVIADSIRAQILTRREDRPGFDIVTAFQSPDGHVSAHQLGGDRPGRIQESANPAHHAMEPRIDPHEENTIQFLRTVAQYLNENATVEEVLGLILFAPPRALGHLRKMLDADVARKIRAEAPRISPGCRSRIYRSIWKRCCNRRHAAMLSWPRRSVVLAALAFLAPHGFAAVPDAHSLKADRVRVIKSERVLQLLADGTVLKSFPIALGRRPKGPKQRRGDGRTPEGFYVIDWRTANTPYHRALHVSYPNIMDLRRAQAAQVPPGGAIFIHGMPTTFGHHDPVRFFVDWTDGCFAVGNIAIEEIWNAVDDGTVIEIQP